MPPQNNYITKILSMPLVKNGLQNLIDKYYGIQLKEIKATAQSVNSITFPRVNEIKQDCINQLQLSERPKVLITKALRGINALALHIDKQPHILLSPKAAICLSDGELKFLLGHELGHIMQGNLVCHVANGLLQNVQKKADVLGVMLADMIEVPLKDWCRENEYRADIAGLKCCQDIEHVYALMARVAKSEQQSMAPSLMEIYKDHPMIANRLKRLEQYRFLNIHHHEN